MANAKLSVEIGAKIDALRDAFNQAIRETSKWDKTTREKLMAVDNGFAKLANEAEKSSNTVSKSLAKSAMVSASSGRAITAGTDKAAFALTNLGRVAQDAPYGFIGIQNNLNPLLESFQRLQVESGSFGGALKALGTSLIGPAGLGIALSVVSAAILFYQQYQQKAKKQTQEVVDANKQYVDSLTGVNAALLKGNESAIKNTENAIQLYKATQDVTISINERTKAAKILQETYPKTFKNFTTEQILVGQAKTAYDELTKSLIAQAQVKAFSDKIAENSIKQLEIQGRFNQKQLEVDKARNILLNEQNKLKISGQVSAGDAQILAKAEGDLAQKESDLGDIRLERFKIDKENLQLQSEITDRIKKQGIAVLGLDRNLKTASSDRNKIDPIDLNAAKKLKEFEVNLNKVGLQFIKIAQSKLPETDISKLVKGEKQLVKVPLEIELVNPEITPESQLRLLKAFEELKPKINDAVSGFFNSIPDAFASLGEVLAQGGNPIEAFGNVLLGSFSDFLKQFGKLLIEYGAAGLGLATVTKALLNPLTAGPAAIAAIAAGIALEIAAGAIKGLISGGGSGQSGKSGIPGFATGVTNYEGGLAIVGESGRELVQLPTGSSVIPNYKTESMLNGMSSKNNLNVVFDTLRITNDAIYIAAKKGAEKLGKII